MHIMKKGLSLICIFIITMNLEACGSRNSIEQNTEKTVDHSFKQETGKSEDEAKEGIQEDASDVNNLDSLYDKVVYGDHYYDLTDDEVIVLDGSYFFDLPCTIVYDKKMNEIKRLDGYSFGGMGDADECGTIIQSLSTPVVLQDCDTSDRGLYSFEEDRWIVEPADIIFFDYNNGDFGFTDFYGDPNETDQYIYNGTDIINIGKSPVCADGYYWVPDEMGYSVMKHASEFITHINAESSWKIGYPEGEIITITDNKGQEWAYSYSGNCLFKPEYLNYLDAYNEIISYTITACTEENGLLLLDIKSGEMEYHESMIYDIETKEFFWPGDGEVISFVRDNDYHYAFLTTGEIGLSVLTDCLSPLKSKDGNTFEYVFGMDCYGYYDHESESVIVESIDGELHYSKPWHESNYYYDQGTMVSKGIILFTSLLDNCYYCEITKLGEEIYSLDSSSYVSDSDGQKDLFLDCAPWYPCGEELIEIYNDDIGMFFNISTGELTYTIDHPSKDETYEIFHCMLVHTADGFVEFLTPYGDLVMKVIGISRWQS